MSAMLARSPELPHRVFTRERLVATKANPQLALARSPSGLRSPTLKAVQRKPRARARISSSTARKTFHRLFLLGAASGDHRALFDVKARELP
jgi:hypothetical protein